MYFVWYIVVLLWYTIRDKNMKIANTKENNAKVKALKTIAGTKWNGNTVHDAMHKCLAAINLDSNNSGHYNPIAARIKGLTGWYMINQDGSIFCDARVIKESEKEYRIEYMTREGERIFEAEYLKQLED